MRRCNRPLSNQLREALRRRFERAGAKAAAEIGSATPVTVARKLIKDVRSVVHTWA
jgi:hypothetical protein